MIKIILVVLLALSLSGCLFAGKSFMIGYGKIERDKETKVITKMESKTPFSDILSLRIFSGGND